MRSDAGPKPSGLCPDGVRMPLTQLTAMARKPLTFRALDPYDADDEDADAWHEALVEAYRRGREAYRMAYRGYCQTRLYRRLRDRVRRAAGGVCQRCGVKHKEMHLHHLHYLTVGKERLHDVRYVCRPCHDMVTQGDRTPIPPSAAQRASQRAAHEQSAPPVPARPTVIRRPSTATP